MKNKFRILIGCEESDEVRGRFEKLGYDAWSCDIKENRNKNAKHYQEDIFNILNQKWDCFISFPPCTHLAVSGSRHFEQKIKDGRQQEGIDFFMKMINADINHIAVENPIGIMSKKYRKPDQIIQPFYFGDKAQKSTCLWLKNLPKLYHNKQVNLFDKEVTHTDKGEFFEWVDKKTGVIKKQPLWYYNALKQSADKRAEIRSKTFSGIAEAMVNQWDNYFSFKYNF
jgi:site-specific DNA-cytosine methylase